MYEQWPSDEELWKRRWTVCCDFHDDPKEIQAHLVQMEKEYGRTKEGELIVPPAGWKILPFREIVPHIHREWILHAGWAFPRRCRSTMTPIFAAVSGWVRVLAVPDNE